MFPREVALNEAVKSWKVCQHILLPRCGALTHQCLRVTSRATKRHVSHAIIRQSTIPRASYGLMLMQQLPSRGEASQVYTDKGEHVATYSMAPITPEEVDHLPTCNYQFCYKARGKVHHYSADSYDGSNIG